MPRRRIPGPIIPKPHQPEFPGSEELVRPRNAPSDVSPYLTQPAKNWLPGDNIGLGLSPQDEARGWDTRDQKGRLPESVIPPHMSPGQFGPHHFALEDTVSSWEDGGPTRRVSAIHANTRSPTSLEMEEPWRLEHPRLPGFDDNTGRLEPWQQTREEFAADPRSWHHAAKNPEMADSSLVRRGLDLPNEERAQGLHLGTMQAALDRRTQVVPERPSNSVTREVVKDPVLGHLSDFDSVAHEEASPEHSSPVFSYRLRFNPSGGITDQGQAWNSTHFNRLYKNEAEDPGSTSIVVPNRESLISHHEAINEALRAGKRVPDHVLAEYGVKPWDTLTPASQRAYREVGVAPVPTPVQLPTSATHSPAYMRGLRTQSSTGEKTVWAEEEKKRDPKYLAEHADEPPMSRVNPSVMPRDPVDISGFLSNQRRFVRGGNQQTRLPSYLQGNLFHEAALQARAKGTMQGYDEQDEWRSHIHPLEIGYQRALDHHQGRGE